MKVQKAFEDLKRYMVEPPLLAKSNAEEVLYHVRSRLWYKANQRDIGERRRKNTEALSIISAKPCTEQN